MIKRDIEAKIRSDFGKGKVVLVLGARQVGKTTLLNQLAENVERVVRINCDNADERERLSNPNTTQLLNMVGNAQLVLIDEAQRIPDVGMVLKMLADALGARAQIVATGSSALELANGVFESAAGRIFEYRLYPLSHGELAAQSGAERTEQRLLQERLVYGSYPEVVTAPNDGRRILESIASGALYKDVLSFGGIRKPDVLSRLVQCLALRLGSEVSANELGQMTGLNKATVESYIDLLEKTFVVFSLRSFARNARNELKRARKIYFWDNGIRNVVLGNFAPLTLRTDVGALWENWLVSERLKRLAYAQSYARSYFWRTTTQSEIDYIEELDGQIKAFEFKWNPHEKAKMPQPFAAAYPNATYSMISRESYDGFLM